MRTRSGGLLVAMLVGLMATASAAITIQEDPAPAAGAAAGETAPEAARAPEVQAEKGVRFITGGTGTDERRALEAMGGGYNLKLTVATEDGTLIVPDMITVANQQGEAVIETAPNGPLLLARLPAGAYSVVATTGDEELTRAVIVPTSGQEAVTLTLHATADPPSAAGDAPAVPRPPVPGLPSAPLGSESGAPQPEEE